MQSSGRNSLLVMVEVKDDIIIPYHQERLKELINSIHFPWYFSETTLGGGGYDAFQFIHLLASI